VITGSGKEQVVRNDHPGPDARQRKHELGAATLRHGEDVREAEPPPYCRNELLRTNFHAAFPEPWAAPNGFLHVAVGEKIERRELVEN